MPYTFIPALILLDGLSGLADVLMFLLSALAILVGGVFMPLLSKSYRRNMSPVKDDIVPDWYRFIIFICVLAPIFVVGIYNSTDVLKNPGINFMFTLLTVLCCLVAMDGVHQLRRKYNVPLPLHILLLLPYIVTGGITAAMCIITMAFTPR